jgi:hypothetical protein
MDETKNQRFKRLAKLRGDRILHDINLIRNLSNRNNYEYSEAEVQKLFDLLDDELKSAKSMFNRNKKRQIDW